MNIIKKQYGLIIRDELKFTKDKIEKLERDQVVLIKEVVLIKDMS